MKQWFLMVALVWCSFLGQLFAEGATQQWMLTRPSDEPAPFGERREQFSLVDWETTPLALGLVAPVQLPWGDWDVRGIRVSPIYGRCVNLTGLDVGFINAVDDDLIGLQAGVFNGAYRAFGLQIGVINFAYYLKGLQIGFINYAEGARGIQIGVVNVITNTKLGFFPIVYGSF